MSQWQQQKNQQVKLIVASSPQPSARVMSRSVIHDLLLKSFCSQFGHEAAPPDQSHVLRTLLCPAKGNSSLSWYHFSAIAPSMHTNTFFSVFTTSHWFIRSRDSRRSSLSTPLCSNAEALEASDGYCRPGGTLNFSGLALQRQPPNS